MTASQPKTDITMQQPVTSSPTEQMPINTESQSAKPSPTKHPASKIDDRLWSAKARHLSPYVPGEQPTHPNLCKLNTNENPYPPSPKVAAAISALLLDQADALRLYPSPHSDALCAQLAQQYGLQADQVFVGNGSDEVLALIFASFFLKERPVLAPDISYSFYPVYAQTFGVDLLTIPLSAEFEIDTDAYRQPCGGIIIANPNAPTGILMPLDAIRKLVSEHPNAVVVIDEAYIDFARDAQDDIPSAVSLIDEFDNLVVVQTFSKSRSLAGLRVGMAFANVSLITALRRVKDSFNSYPLDRLAQAGALASLEDVAYFKQTCQRVIHQREQLERALTQLEFVVLPSQANFLFVKPPAHFGSAEILASKLREEGIIVRHFAKPRISDYLRITVGTAEQNSRLILALKGMIG